MTEIIVDKRENLEQKAADIISDSINNLLKKQETVVLAIPGGRSVTGIFKNLKEKNIPWKKAHIFIVDERLVPIDHKESNFRLAKESFIEELINKGLLPKENTHPFILNKSEPDSGISAYQEEIKKHGSIYDIVLLSSGEDGHIGALYPSHHSIKDNSDYYITMHDSPKPPKDRMTMSKKLLSKSKVAILLFFGEGKRQAYNKFLDKSINISSCPAKLINQIKHSYVLTDLK